MLDQVTGLRVFAKVAALSSFSAAGRALGMSQTMVTRHIAAIESRLGVALVLRTTRHIALTEAGERYRRSAERILAEWAEAEAETSSELGPRGVLRLNTPVAFGVREIAPLLPEFARRFPDVSIDLGMTDRNVDLIEEGWDLAIRIGRLRDSSLVARRLASIRAVVAASPAYLARRGRPTAIADLAGHDCLGYTLPTPVSAERWHFGRQSEIAVPVAGTLRANNGDVLRLAALEGGGLIYQPTFIVGDDLRAGHLVALEFDQPYPEPNGVHAVYAPGRYPPAKIRSFIDFLVGRWGEDPPWDRGLPMPATNPVDANQPGRADLA